MAISCVADSWSLVGSYPSPPAGATTLMVGYYPRYKIEQYTNSAQAPIVIDMRDRFTRTGSAAYECNQYTYSIHSVRDYSTSAH